MSSFQAFKAKFHFPFAFITCSEYHTSFTSQWVPTLCAFYGFLLPLFPFQSLIILLTSSLLLPHALGGGALLASVRAVCCVRFVQCMMVMSPDDVVVDGDVLHNLLLSGAL